MFFIPFPVLIAEFVIFWLAVQRWGFFDTLGIYLLPSILGLIIMNLVGRMALMNLQGTAMQGKVPGNKLLHSGALFLSGLLFLIPAFFSRVFAIILFLPGTRHLAVWGFKAFMAKKITQGAAQAFNFGASGGPFGFGTGSSGFRYYEYRGSTGFGTEQSEMKDVEGLTEEREVREANVLDVKPLEIIHQDKKEDK